MKVTVELSEDVVQRARAAAAQGQRPLEDVLAEWIGRAATERPVELLPDDQLVALCNAQMDPHQQDELNELLSAKQEGALPEPQRFRLDELLRIYRRGLVRKAQALHVAVQRGLSQPLS